MLLQMNWDIVIRMMVNYFCFTLKFLSYPEAFLTAKSVDELGQDVLECGIVMVKIKRSLNCSNDGY